MNYTVLVYFGVMAVTVLWYAVSARKWFKGPKINVQHAIHGQDLGNEDAIPEQRAIVTRKTG